MKITNFIEKHCKWLQIKNLPVFLAFGYIVFYVLILSQTVQVYTVDLYGYGVLENKEYWRLFTFFFITLEPPLFFAFLVYIQWFFGMELENIFGPTKFTLFFLLHFLIAISLSFLLPEVRLNETFMTTVFLAFAFIYPDYLLMPFFLFRIKIKWLAMIEVLRLSFYLVDSEFSATMVAMNLTIFLPIFLFFGKDIYNKIKYKTRKTIITAHKQIAAKKHHHQCLVCDSTDITNPNKEFRYIEVNGQLKCYCDDHTPDKIKK